MSTALPADTARELKERIELYVVSPNRPVKAPGDVFELAWTKRLLPTFTLRRYAAPRAPCLAVSDLDLLMGATIAVAQAPTR